MATQLSPTALRTDLYADPAGVFVHGAILAACRQYGEKIAFVDGDRRISYAQYGAMPTPLNPSYKEREVRYQLENSGAKFLISDGPLVAGMNLGGLPSLQRVYTTRAGATGSQP